MKKIFFLALSIVTLPALGANLKNSTMSHMTSDGEYHIALNYNLTAHSEKMTKLAEASAYVGSIQAQIVVENDKLDRLISKLADDRTSYQESRKISKEVEKQKDLALELIKKAEAVDQYVQLVTVIAY